MALTCLVDTVLRAYERGHSVLVLFLDLSEAFDCTDYEILFNKLYRSVEYKADLGAFT